MKDVIVYEQKPSLWSRAKRFAQNATMAVSMAVGTAVGTVMVATPAYAIDTTEVVNTIKGTTTATDAIGLAIIGVVTGIVVISMIVGMIARKGR